MLTQKRYLFLIAIMGLIVISHSNQVHAQIALAQSPLFFSGTVPPLNMLVMGRDHTLYYEAYNDASDLNGDGVIDVGYVPSRLTYYGYFDSNRCYTYNDTDSPKRFNPTSVTTNKKCAGSNEWSGDFLNYITTARIDALRKVLYGGHRVVDTEQLTVLERSYIPQDAHSWGKEYKSIVNDGYDITEYTPLSLPSNSTRHLFANTTLLNSGSKEPLMRVLTNSKYRIWEWVAKEQPVAGSKCIGGACEYGASQTSANTTHPENNTEFQALFDKYGNSQYQCGSGPLTGGINVSSTTDGAGNPFKGATYNDCTKDNYLTLIQGQINIPTTGTYSFATNGDDAVEFLIEGKGVVAAWYGSHGRCGTIDCIPTKGAPISLAAGIYNFTFHHEEVSGGDNYQLFWKTPAASSSWVVVPADSLVNPSITTYRKYGTIPASVMTDYQVRVKVCDKEAPSGFEANCQQYPNNYYKPTGLLQNYGETDRMLFGLISGSYGSSTSRTNIAGGVLRKNIESFKNEVNLTTGQFSTIKGIVDTIDQFRIVDYGVGTEGSKDYNYKGGWLATAPMPNATGSAFFPDWGNPIGEMLYESLRYFSGKTAATSAFMPALTNGAEQVTLLDPMPNQSVLSLSAPAWKDPYLREDQPRPYCSPAVQLVISDVNPSYDTDQVPGSSFATFNGDVSGFNATDDANAIWAIEHGGTSKYFIGQVGTTYDGAPSAKDVSGLGNIRGLSPSEPTKQGGYYGAAVARYGFKNDIRKSADFPNDQNIQTFSVALASPLPKLEIPVGDKRISVVPFGKSVRNYGISPNKKDFQPTNTIVDFFVESFANTDTSTAQSDANPNINQGRPYIKFRINYEDVEQGADHDMDAIVTYELKVTDAGLLQIALGSEYASGSIEQHLGYVISGTTQDGLYLEVRDCDTANSTQSAPCINTGNNPSTVTRYYLDTPPGTAPGECAASPLSTSCNVDLPLSTTRTFTPDNSLNKATLLKDPLWYAAKYGSKGNENLSKGEKSPNYFLVTNASTLQKQLESAFNRIDDLTASASAVATNSTQLNSGAVSYQARFRSSDWSGQLIATKINTVVLDESLPEDAGTPLSWTDAGDLIPQPASRRIFTQNNVTKTGISFDWTSLTADQKALLNHSPISPYSLDNKGEDRVSWLRGDRSKEQQNGGSFRNRAYLLGDIVNFNPVLVKADYFGYEKLPVDQGGGDCEASGRNATNCYLKFYDQNRTNRIAMLYVGANDGMLHGINAETGVESFAYVPNALIPALNQLSNPKYQHRYYVDGQGFAGDAYLDNAWKTILVTTLGAGGKAVFALDVTKPSEFDQANVLWEFTDPDLGNVIGEAQVVRMANGQWAAVFGNGYNSNNQKAFLFIVNLKTGELIKKIEASTGLGTASNGLAPPALIPDATRTTITAAYAGDLLGNLWKFDLSNNAASSWGVSYLQGGVPQPLFTAVGPDLDANNKPQLQPITARPGVIAHPDGGFMVLFGTGRYFAVGDNIVAKTGEPAQSLYGIWDKGSPVAATQANRATVLQQQTIQAERIDYAVPNATWTVDLRVLSKNEVDWTSKKGWFLDLVSPVVGKEGERIKLRPIFRRDRVLFTSLIPLADPCKSGGHGWFMEFDALSGGRLDYTLFNVNNDTLFDDNDFVQVGQSKVPVSGLGIDGIPSLPTIVRDSDGNEIRLLSTTESSQSNTSNSALVGARGAARSAAAAAAAAADQARAVRALQGAPAKAVRPACRPAAACRSLRPPPTTPAAVPRARPGVI